MVEVWRIVGRELAKPGISYQSRLASYEKRVGRKTLRIQRMKLYGYTEADSTAEVRTPSALKEASLVGLPSELREIARFLTDCAAEMERMGDVFDHVHLCDRTEGFDDSPQLIVARDRTT